MSADGPRPSITGFEQFEFVGQGGYGMVFRAFQPKLNRHVAIKVLTVALDGTALRRFEREQKAMGALSAHPGIVTLHDSGMTDTGLPYLVMEWMEGGTLQERLEREGPLPWQEAVEIMVKIAGAVEYTHQAGVIHRDIKPGNLLVSPFGEVKLADFGIAALVGGAPTVTSSITATVEHAAPEVLGGKTATAAADIYSLASSLFTLVAGHSPFRREQDDSLIPVLTRALTEPVPDLRPLGVPHPICLVIEQAMAKEPGARVPAAAEFARHLEAAVQHAVAPTAPGGGGHLEPAGSVSLPAARSDDAGLPPPHAQDNSRTRRLPPPAAQRPGTMPEVKPPLVSHHAQAQPPRNRRRVREDRAGASAALPRSGMPASSPTDATDELGQVPSPGRAWRVRTPWVSLKTSPGALTTSIRLPADTMLVEVERHGSYIRVRAPNGTEGWTPSRFLRPA